jgi:hypothetical protein
MALGMQGCMEGRKEVYTWNSALMNAGRPRTQAVHFASLALDDVRMKVGREMPSSRMTHTTAGDISYRQPSITFVSLLSLLLMLPLSALRLLTTHCHLMTYYEPTLDDSGTHSYAMYCQETLCNFTS